MFRYCEDKYKFMFGISGINFPIFHPFSSNNFCALEPDAA